MIEFECRGFVYGVNATDEVFVRGKNWTYWARSTFGNMKIVNRMVLNKDKFAIDFMNAYWNAKDRLHGHHAVDVF